MPTIAIVLATYNGARTLDAALDSLADQSSIPDQIIVVDGASTDGTIEILERRNEMLSHWLSEPDNGLYDAWNKALSKVTCEWVCFVGCDDLLADRDTIAWWRRELAQGSPHVGIAYGQVAMIGANGEANELYGEPWTDRSPKRLRSRMLIPFTGTMIRKALLDKVGTFDTAFRVAGDYEWALRAVPRTQVISFRRTVALMGDGGLSGASDTQVAALRELDRIFEANGWPRPLAWRWASIKGRAKLALIKYLGSGVQRWAVDIYRLLTGRKSRGAAR